MTGWTETATGALRVGLALVAALCALHTFPATAFAQVHRGGFEVDSTEWNGLSAFRTLALEEGLSLEVTDTLDYDALNIERPLVLVHPGPDLDASAIQSFVSDGGRVLIFDDFGGSAALLADFSDPIERVAPLPPAAAREYLNGNPELPVLDAPGRHALLEGSVDRLVANHAAGYVSTLPAVVYYADGELGFVYDLTIGAGKLIVVGDASLPINLMLPVADNRVFVGNALRYVCQGQATCTAELLVGDFESRGTYGEGDESNPSAAVQDGLESLNEALQKLDDFVPERRLMRVMTLLLMVGLVLFGLTVFPTQAARFLSIRFRPPPRLLPESEFERNLREYRTGDAENYALPISILRDEFEHLVLEALYEDAERPDDEARYRTTVIADTSRRFAARLAPDGSDEYRRRERQLVGLFKTLARVPGQTQNYIEPGPRWSEKNLVDVHAQCVDVLSALGALESYEQRIRRR